MTVSEICSSVPEAFRPAYAGETETSGIEVAPALGRIETDWNAAPPIPGDLGSWLAFERFQLDVWFGGSIHDPMQRSGS